jgi:hypothetical protein
MNIRTVIFCSFCRSSANNKTGKQLPQKKYSHTDHIGSVNAVMVDACNAYQNPGRHDQRKQCPSVYVLPHDDLLLTVRQLCLQVSVSLHNDHHGYQQQDKRREPDGGAGEANADEGVVEDEQGISGPEGIADAPDGDQ